MSVDLRFPRILARIARARSRYGASSPSSVDSRLLEMALAPDDPGDGWLTAKRAARQTKVERVTASCDLARLEELGVVERDPSLGGRSTRYRVRLGQERPVLLVKDMTWS